MKQGKAATYDSNDQFRLDRTKHLRRANALHEEYLRPLTESQKIGWRAEENQKVMRASHRMTGKDMPMVTPGAGPGEAVHARPWLESSWF